MIQSKHNILGVKVKNYGECGYCKDNPTKVQLNIPWSIWAEWTYITAKNHSREWSAVFWVEDNTVTRYEIPLQEVGAVSVEFKEDLGGDGIIHSHHSMGAFHSGQDDKHERNLYNYSIVLDSKNEYVACTKVILPCGGFGYFDVDIIITGMPELKEEHIQDIVTISYQHLPQHYVNDTEKKNYQYPHEITEEEKRNEKRNEDLFDENDYDFLPCGDCVDKDCKNCVYSKNETIRPKIIFQSYGMCNCDICGKWRHCYSVIEGEIETMYCYVCKDEHFPT